jgi:hypothetical protein
MVKMAKKMTVEIIYIDNEDLCEALYQLRVDVEGNYEDNRFYACSRSWEYSANIE